MKAGRMLLGATWLALGHRRPPPATADDRIEAVVVFGGREIRSTASPFRGWSLTAIFGGYGNEAGALPVPDGLDIRTLVLFGGVDVKVRALAVVTPGTA